MPERRRWTRARRWVIVGGVVVVLGGGATAWAATRSSGPAYRLATAGPAQVSSVLSATGTIQSVNQATLGFPVSGQVSAVNVQVGQQVTQGEVLATLDTTNLSTQVSSAQARAAAAQAKLASDENGQTAAASPAGGSSGAGSGSAGGGSGSSGGRAPSTGGGKPGGPPPAVASGQSAVEKAQHQVDGDLATDNAAVGQEKSACAQATGAAPAAYTRSSSTPSPSQGTDPSTSAPPTTSTEPPSGGSGNSGATAACTSAIQQVLDDQSKTASDEKALADAENGLTTALDQATAAASGGGSSSGSAGSSAPSAPSAPSGSSGSPGSAGRTGGSPGSSAGGRATAPPSADQLAADQASVDATNADLAAATQNLSAATITSPIAGTVAQVTLTAGQTVAGASTQNDIVVIGPGSDEVTTTVSDLQVGQVRPGQRSTITPDGTTLRLPGLVTQVGILGSSSGGSVTYPVTISLDPTSQQLFAGATAAVSVDIASTNAGVAVPTSAVQAQGARQIVTVMRNGTATPVPVTVGVVGSTMTEIRSGLRSGDRVVIADLSEPLPTGNTNNLRIGGGGGFGGAGGAGGAGGGRAGGGGAGGRPGG